MTNKNGEKRSANDNRFVCVSGIGSTQEISARLRSVLDELSSLGTSDTALIEALFSSMTEISYRSFDCTGDDPENRHLLGRYNQLSRLSGELEGMKTILWQEWAERLSEA